jgi:enamine deaminase RidA (YjgF/YER057c/UK114 family)
MNADARFANLDLQLPPAPKPMGLYRPMVTVGNIAYLSGHGPLCADKTLIVGKVGAELSLEQGKLAARQVGLALLATLKSQLGSLSRVSRVVKLLGMVNATTDFQDHPSVINGASELFAAVWGPENGVGARSAVGMASLPSNMAVEIEMVVELEVGDLTSAPPPRNSPPASHP